MRLQKSVYLLSFLLLVVFTSDLNGQFRRKKVKLSETNKIEEFPIILVGTDFWGGLMDWVKATLLDKFNNISAKDLDLIHLVDSADEVIDILDNFYKDYGLSPNF